MHRSPFCREQKQDRFVFIRSHKVLPGIGFFLPGVVAFPVSAVFRALDRSLRSIHERIFHMGKERRKLVHAFDSALGKDAPTRTGPVHAAEQKSGQIENGQFENEI